MEIEVFTLCDAATDSRGKLNILGTFDSIYASGFPMVFPRCSIALRLRYAVIEEGEHAVKITMRDQEGKDVIPPMEGSFHLKVMPERFSAAANLVLNLERLRIPQPGEYLIELSIDGDRLRTLPLNAFQNSPRGPERDRER